MAKRTSIDEVGEAVAAVKEMQGQIVGLLDAMKLLIPRIEAIERKLAKGAKDV